MIIVIAVCSSNATISNDEKIERDIKALITSMNSSDSIISLLKLIEWESDLIYQIPCIPPTFVYHQLRVSSHYGRRVHPIHGNVKHHNGIDLPLSHGDTVVVSADGKVTSQGYDRRLGNFVKVRHICGFETVYGHLSKILVVTGEVVKISKPIGLCGSTGDSTGPHVHYGIKKNGVFINPLDYCELLFEMQK